jgi:hypothetical protein
MCQRPNRDGAVTRKTPSRGASCSSLPVRVACS